MGQHRVTIITLDQFRRVGLEQALANAGFQVVPAGASDEKTLRRLVVDALLLDSSTVPDPHYILVGCRRWLPAVPVLALGTTSNEADILLLLCASAKGYVHLLDRPQDIAPAVRGILAGNVWAPRRVIGALIDRVSNPHSFKPLRISRPYEDVLRLIVNEGLTNKECATRLGIDERTVEARLTALKRRYGVANRSQLIIYSIKNGLVPFAPVFPH